MWKVAVVVAVLAGCGASDESDVCGNNRVEAKTETCDGTAVASCGELGYYDGTSACVGCMEIDTSACRACASGATACAHYAQQRFAVGKLVASGTHVLALSGSRLRLFDGTTLLREIDDAPVLDAIGVPGGFLVAGSQQLIPLGFDGSFGTPQTLPLANPVFAGNSAGRVLVAWQDGSNIVSAIAEPSGVLVTPIATVFAAGTGPTSIASDGTQFFLGNAGRLARIAGDNTLLGITTGFPLAGADVLFAVIWDGIAGWYVADYQIQRFTATGEPAGTQMMSPMVDVAAGTDKLLVLAFESPELVIRGFSSQRSAISRTPLGTGAAAGAIVQLGDQVLGMWDVREARAALVAAP